MAEREPVPVAVVGLGLIGGSVALALVERGITVLGADASAVARRLAAGRGVRVVTELQALGAAAPDVVVLSVPLGQLAAVATALLPHLPPHAVVLHTAGLQRPEAVGLHGAAAERVVGAHPIAGSQADGFTAARASLFEGAAVWVEERAGSDVRARAEWLWRTVGAGHVAYRPASEHDREMAWASHLPQLVATAVAATLADARIAAAAGGPGLHGVTRLAASPPTVWLDLLRLAPPDTAAALTATARTLDQLAAAVAAGDVDTMSDTWARARRWRAGEEDAR